MQALWRAAVLLYGDAETRHRNLFRHDKTMTKPAIVICPRPRERGNALFLVAIAVALFGALSYAVTYAGRSGSYDQERNLVTAAHITQYPAEISTAFKRMVRAGMSEDEISFDEGDMTPQGVFSAHGGGIVSERPPREAGSSSAWRYKTAPRDGDGRRGWYVAGIGADDAGGKEVFAFLDRLTAETCANLMRSLGLEPAPRVEPQPVDFSGKAEGTPAQDGGADGDDAIADAAGSAFNAWNDAGNPQPYACVRNGDTGAYVYYHVLMAH